ncbi:hypothetical protein NO932_11755 [Pelagibacterium sp. 26DY04]|uniref:hypothetical protein n=1 Tax=Pelagibacterium sp. 26DY04 TaxID=2967130 RepID=UPI0028163D1B|nr:hypothetical protein [Pelagibacterium sp. 26DY04]WMT85603.1 hypothetical protein NO932_11755 [Pelagibacterium sp. 26DY04]
MPNKFNMEIRIAQMLQRVGAKQLKTEADRIDELLRAGRVSPFTARKMRETAPIRLAYLAA